MPFRRPTSDSAGDQTAAVQAIKRDAQQFDSIESCDLDPLLRRIADAEVVLMGEASHGTSEFYGMRARITAELIRNHGFRIVAVEADWPDAEHVDEYVRHRREKPPREWSTFGRFPTWMWRNKEVLEFLERLREHNADREEQERAGFYGLDLYSLYSSMAEVLRFLEDVDPELAAAARARYQGLVEYRQEPAEYGRRALMDRYASYEDQVVEVLTDILQKRLNYMAEDPEGFFDAERNAAVVAGAEKYYRLMFQGSRASWNHRDTHMFETLNAVRAFRGKGNDKAIVWAHNSHIGDAGFTEMGRHGEINIGHLCKQSFGADSVRIGFGTHTGRVAAASDWGEDMEIKNVRPSHHRSYENLFHEAGIGNGILPLRQEHAADARQSLMPERLERAIGVIYRPESELMSHYFEAQLPEQFDEYIWFDESFEVQALDRAAAKAPELPARHPLLLGD